MPAPRGRKPQNVIAHERLLAAPGVVERPPPPAQLTDEQALIWRAVVNPLPADWFDSATFPLLEAYCRHTVQARQLAQLIDQATLEDDINLRNFDQLLNMHKRESDALATLATKMRIAQQSITNHRGNRTSQTQVKRPWEA